MPDTMAVDQVPRSERRYCAGEDVRRVRDGAAVHVLAVNFARLALSPYCVADDPEHVRQEWLAEQELAPLDGRVSACP